VSDDGEVVTRGPSERTTITSLFLNVGDDGTFRHGSKRKDVSNAKRGLLSGVDELPGVHSLVGNKSLMAKLVTIRVTEDNLGKGGSSTGVVDYILHNTADVAMALTVVEGSEFGRVLSQPGVGSEDRPGTLSLITDDSSHREFWFVEFGKSVAVAGVGVLGVGVGVHG